MSLTVGELLVFLRLDSAGFNTGIGAAQAGMNATAGSAERLGGAVGIAERQLAATSRTSGVATAEAVKYRAAQLGAVAAAERYAAVLDKENVSLRELALAEKQVVLANERLRVSSPAASMEATAVAAERTSSRMGVSAASSIATLGKLGFAFGAFELLKKAFDITKEANSFQRAMVQTQTNADVSAAEVNKASGALLAMAGPVAASPEKLAIAWYHAKSVGLDYAKSIETTRLAAEGARVGHADLEETMNALTSTVASGIPGVGNMSRAMGQLIAIVGTGDMKLKDLNEALGSGILTVVKGYGLSLTDVGAALATFGDNNIRGAQAATMLRMAVQAMAVPAKAGKNLLNELGLTSEGSAAALAKVHLQTGTLAKDMQTGGLNKAVLDLKKHLDNAGVSGVQTGQVLTEMFGKRAGPGIAVLIGQIDRLESKFRILRSSGATFDEKWKATTQTASFALARVGHSAEAAGIALTAKLGPSIAAAANALGTALPTAISLAHGVLTPFAAAWHLLGDVVPPVGHALAEVGHVLGPVLPVMEGVGAAALAMWAAFKGYQMARSAVYAIADGAAVMSARVKNAAADSAASLGLMARDAGTTATVMQADLAAIGAAATEQAAVIDRDAASAAEAQLALARATGTASESQIASYEAVAAAATAQATKSEAAAVTTAAAAEAAAAEVDAAGEAASVGWAGVAGPIALAAIGVFTLVTMFHKSSQASKEATDAAKAYTDALSGSGGKVTIADTIQKQLTDNNVPAAIDKLNKALGSSAYTGQQFADAIQHGGPALDALRERLTIVAASNIAYLRSGASSEAQSKRMEVRYETATKLLKDLNDQYSGLSKATKKDLVDTKAFAGTSSSLDAVDQKMGVATGTAAKYAAMVGILGDKNGVTQVSQDALNRAVAGVSKAYNNATATGSDYLKALQTFSSSAQTAADRAAMIGSMLKASNGDALSFSGAMAGTTSAVNTLTDAFKSQRDQLAQQSADQQKAADGVTKAQRGTETSTARVAAAEARLAQVRGNGKATAAQIRSAEAAVTAAQNASKNSADKLGAAQSAAGKAGALAYSDTERAAIKFKQTAHGLTATIDTNAKGAGDLVTQMEGMQTSAMGAAEALYQNEVATKGGNVAALDAYNIYRTKTYQALIDQAAKLGLTKQQAKALANEYFSIKDSGDIKKAIGMVGDNKVVDVLTRIGNLLAHLTGQPWDLAVNIVTRGKLPHAAPTHNGQIVGPGYATGTTNATAGLHWVGEHGPELVLFNGGEKVLDNKASTKAPASSTLQTGNIAEALHGMRIVIDAGSVGTLTGFVDSRVDGTLGRAARTPAARQARVDAFGRT